MSETPPSQPTPCRHTDRPAEDAEGGREEEKCALFLTCLWDLAAVPVAILTVPAAPPVKAQTAALLTPVKATLCPLPGSCSSPASRAAARCRKKEG